MSTPFDVRSWASQAGIQTTGGFAVVAECVTLDELERFAQIAIAAAAKQLHQKDEAPAVAVNEQMLKALKFAHFFVEELTNAAGKYAGLEGQIVADAYMVSAKLNIAIAAAEAAKKGGE